MASITAAKKGPWGFLAIGLLMTAIQLLSLLSSRPADPNKRVDAVFDFPCTWDCGHYSRIVREGYSFPLEEGVAVGGSPAFFPGLPLIGRFFYRFGISSDQATLLASWFAGVLFWAFFAANLESKAISIRQRALVLGLMASYPSSYYLVSGYSESAFCFLLTAFLYLTRNFETSSLKDGAKAAVFGFGLCLTRILGIVGMIALPLIAGASFLRSLRQTIGISTRSMPLRAVAIGAVGSLGVLGYFGWCQWKGGDWAAYFHAREAGWRAQSDPLFFLHFLSGARSLDRLSGENPRSVSQWLAILNGAGLLASFAYGVRVFFKRKSAEDASGFDFAWLHRTVMGIGFFYLAGVSASHRLMDCMIRYTLPCFVILCLNVGDLFGRQMIRGRRKTIFKLVLVFLILFFAILQGQMALRHFNSVWVS